MAAPGACGQNAPTAARPPCSRRTRLETCSVRIRPRREMAGIPERPRAERCWRHPRYQAGNGFDADTASSNEIQRGRARTSPDGRWLAYSRMRQGSTRFTSSRFQRWVREGRAISSAGGTEPLWSHTGNELFYRDGAGNLRAVKVNSHPTFSAGGSTILFPAADFFAYPYAAEYAVSRDDQRFVMVRTVGATTPDKLIVVDNWFEELRGKGGQK